MFGLGSLIGGAMKIGGSIFGGLKASQAMKQVRKNLDNQLRENQDWYDRRYNEDATQRADAQRMLAMTNDLIRQRNRAAAGTQAVMGGTEESVAATKAANASALADTASKIAVAGANRKDDIENKGKELGELGKKIATYDYDMPQVPDPQYDMLCKLPDFFKALSAQLLRAKKANIERMMRDQLNMNLVVYAGVIGRVELSADDSDEISFKIFHKNNNEIYLSQLNAGAKQTVMQVLLKVLYNLGDYEPPVMIDTVMGVLDKESREVILERYFPDLAHQTILLSTDTEITTEHDFEKIQAYVAKTYTLHRDKENQCTTISEDYFGLKTKEY